MAKFHINPNTGEPGECKATKGKCPFAGEEEHYDSMEEARAAYEVIMSDRSVISHEKKTLHPDIFVSVLTSTQEVLTERFAPDLGADLEPGEYVASYYDSKSDSDRLIRIKVDSDGSVSYDKLSKFKALVSPSSPKTQTAVSSLRSGLESLMDKSDPSYCKDQKIDRITLIETANGIRRSLAKYDWNNAEGASLGRKEIEDIEWVIDHDLSLAESQGQSEEINALREGKRLVSGFLSELTNRRS